MKPLKTERQLQDEEWNEASSGKTIKEPIAIAIAFFSVFAFFVKILFF
jgi:hypothetical protein